MAEKENLPPNPSPGSDPDQKPIGKTTGPESDDSILDFGIAAPVREGASGIIPLADLPDPQSSPSLVSWTEVIRQHRESAPAPVSDASAAPVQIDSTSDKDLLARIAEEEKAHEPIPTAESAERDTDKLGSVPMVGAEKTGSSVLLDRPVEEGSEQPRSGSAVRFDVGEPPDDAAGAMPSPWADAMIPEAIPVYDASIADQDLPMADVVGPTSEELEFIAALPGAGVSGSAVNFGGEHKSEDIEDIMEGPLVEEGPTTGRSSILDVLVDDDRLEEVGTGRGTSDIVDAAAGTSSGVLSDIDSGLRHAEEALLAAEDIPDAPMAEVEAWADSVDVPASAPAIDVDAERAAEPASAPAIDVDAERAAESVDLYAEGPLTQGITESGTLEMTEAQLEEANRKQQIVESSAIDLSSSPSTSMFDMNLGGSGTAEETVDMSLPESRGSSVQSSMIRPEDLSAQQLPAPPRGRGKAAPAEDEYPATPARGRRTREPAAPSQSRAPQEENELPAEAEAPRKAARSPRAEKAEAPRRRGGGLLLGAFLGILLAAGGIGSAWYLKQLPDPDSVFGDGAAKNKDSGANSDELAKAKKETEEAKKAANDMVVALSKQLKDAGIDDAKPEDGLKKALANKAEAESKWKDANTALDEAVKAKEAAGMEMMAVVEKVKPKKDQKVVDAIQDLLAGKTKAEEEQKKAETAIEAAVKQLKDAGIDDPKLDDGLKKVLAGKTDAETKVKNALAALDKAGVKDPDVTKALAMLITAKDNSDATAKGVRERLEKAKIVPANADQASLFKAVDEAITRGSADAVVKLAAEKKAAEDRAASLDVDLKKTQKEYEAISAKAKNDLAAQKSMYEAKLADVRTPAQVVDVWLPALADKEQSANPAAAIADADLVLKNNASSDADRAKALAVKALALRNQGKLTDARAAFADARKHPGFAKDQAWAKAVAGAADTLENPAAFVGITQPAAAATQQQLIERVESGLKLFDGDKYAKDRARLTAQRSLLKLDANDLAGAFADATEAVKSGAGADGQFALARVLEAQGKFTDAEPLYRDILKAQPEGSTLYRQASLGLARVLLQKIRPAAVPTSTSMLDPESFRGQMAFLLILVADPASAIPPDIQEALKLADALIAQKEFHGYIIRADALAKLGRYNDALAAYSTGIKALKVLPKEYDGVLDRILAQHPALQKPDPNVQPDPSRSLKHYAQGLEFYRAGQFGKAEEQFVAAIREWNKDARYMYYLGLSRLAQGQKKVADEDFKAGALLEMRGLPLPTAITQAFEPVQGNPRAALEVFRP